MSSPKVLLLGDLSVQWLTFCCLCDKKWKIKFATQESGRNDLCNSVIVNKNIEYPIDIEPEVIFNCKSNSLFTAIDKSHRNYDLIVSTQELNTTQTLNHCTVIYINVSTMQIESISYGKFLNGSLVIIEKILSNLQAMKKLQLNPIVLMIAAKVNKNPNNNEQDDNSSDEVDNDLKELIMGTEEMTYGEDFFFDANPVNNETLSAPVSEPNITSSTNSIVASTDLNSRFQTNHLIPSSAPIMATTLYDDRGNTYLLQPSGYVLPVSKPNALIKPKTKRTKKRMFYHMPIPTTRNTPTEKLVESHIKVLEVVNFDEILDQTSTSRYKDLDTSTFVLHNSNISSKASSFKSSIAKNSLNSSIELSNSSKSSIEPTSSSEQIGKSSSPPLPDLKEE